MRVQAEIVGITDGSYAGKRGEVEQWVVTLLDRGEHPRCKSTFDLELDEEQAAKLPSHDTKLVGKLLTVAVTDFRGVFGGRQRVRGEIVEIKA